MSDTPRRRRRPRGRRLAVALAGAALLCVGVLELAARLATGKAPNGMPVVLGYPLLPFRPTEAMVRQPLASTAGSTYVVEDPQLGWCVGPGGEVKLDGGFVLYRSNAQSVRAAPERVYAADPPPGRVRVVTLGDSFTHCDDVPNEDTWQVALEAARPELEVLNLGVPGFGTDQACLRWERDGVRLRSQLVLLGIWPENMCRNLNLVRYYLVPTEGYSVKPRFLLEHGALRLVNSPVLDEDGLVATLTAPEAQPLLAHERWYEPADSRPSLLQHLRSVAVAESVLALYQRKQARGRMYSGEDPSAIELTVAIAGRFAEQVRAAGSTPLILMLPMRDLLAQHTGPQPFPLVAALRAAGLDVLDLGPSFGRTVLSLGEERMYIRKGHHTPEANRLLAAALEVELRPWIEAALRAGR